MPIDPGRLRYNAKVGLTPTCAAFNTSYNPLDQTTAMTPPGGSTINMAYTGQTQDERVAAGSKTFAYSLLGLGVERDAGATAFVRDNSGKLVSMRKPDGTSYYYLFNALGSVVALTDQSGSVVKTYD